MSLYLKASAVPSRPLGTPFGSNPAKDGPLIHWMNSNWLPIPIMPSVITTESNPIPS